MSAMQVRRFFFTLSLALLCGFALASPAPAATLNDAGKFIDRVVAEAMSDLRSSDFTSTERVERLAALLQENFDIPRITRFVLGRYWKTASEEDRTAFGTLFGQFVVKTYSSRMSQFTEETVKVQAMRIEGETSAVVTSEIVHPSGPPTPLEWRVRNDAGTLRIVDIDVAGISMALTEREEFAAFIQRSGGSIAELNKALAGRLHDEAVAAH
jgi:phospholipid transport system substrate-binding protein